MVTESRQLQPADQDVDEIVAVRGLEPTFSQCVDECHTVEVGIVGANEDPGDRALHANRVGYGKEARKLVEAGAIRNVLASESVEGAKLRSGPRHVRHAVGDVAELGRAGDRPMPQIDL